MFRGAVNALGMVQANYTYHLTQSFRFGPQIGFVANTCLEQLQNVKAQTLIGGKKRDFIMTRNKIQDLKTYKPIAFIARTVKTWFLLFFVILLVFFHSESQIVQRSG